MKLSPIGAFGGMAYTIGKFGFASLALLGKLMLTFYATGFIFIFVVLNLICRYFKFSLWKLLGYLKEAPLKHRIGQRSRHGARHTAVLTGPAKSDRLFVGTRFQ